MNELRSALARVVEAMREADVPYMVIGGLANLVWGEPRTTRDVDVTIDASRLDDGAAVELARRVGEPMADDPLDLARRGRIVPVKTPEGTEVDITLGTVGYELDAIGRARLVDLGGVEVSVCSPEDLIVHKVVSQRARDHEDIVGVLRRRGRDLDVAGLDRTVTLLAEGMDEPEILERWRGAKAVAGL